MPKSIVNPLTSTSIRNFHVLQTRNLPQVLSDLADRLIARGGRLEVFHGVPQIIDL